ncbi:hypothetical protein SCP_0214400 [Sparassis crispa]|uniref:Uncharacterized protein n=1 Tax=Sparassis crispa TaxID=139825 RepID=A0A401GDI6_9APHY|nr:hypothetical protein SCP_0214400 [Sparassis crispa]GBE80230.1 hypothetical protein SCP_0214400 [Sparassis crispa]
MWLANSSILPALNSVAAANDIVRDDEFHFTACASTLAVEWQRFLDENIVPGRPLQSKKLKSAKQDVGVGDVVVSRPIPLEIIEHIFRSNLKRITT